MPEPYVDPVQRAKAATARAMSIYDSLRQSPITPDDPNFLNDRIRRIVELYNPKPEKVNRDAVGLRWSRITSNKRWAKLDEPRREKARDLHFEKAVVPTLVKILPDLTDDDLRAAAYEHLIRTSNDVVGYDAVGFVRADAARRKSLKPDLQPSDASAGSTRTIGQGETIQAFENSIGSPAMLGMGAAMDYLAGNFRTAGELDRVMLNEGYGKALRWLQPAEGFSDNAFDNTAAWMEHLSQTVFKGSENQPTGKYAEEIKSVKELADPQRAYQLFAQNAPLMGGLMAVTAVNPALATGIMFGGEGGDVIRLMGDYELRHDIEIPGWKRASIALAYGGANAWLEKTGIEKILDGAKLQGFRARLFGALTGYATEVGTEGVQGGNLMLARELFDIFNEYDLGEYWPEFYGNMLASIPTAGIFSAGAAAIPREAQSPPVTPEMLAELKKARQRVHDERAQQVRESGQGFVPLPGDEFPAQKQVGRREVFDPNYMPEHREEDAGGRLPGPRGFVASETAALEEAYRERGWLNETPSLEQESEIESLRGDLNWPSESVDGLAAVVAGKPAGALNGAETTAVIKEMQKTRGKKAKAKPAEVATEAAQWGTPEEQAANEAAYAAAENRIAELYPKPKEPLKGRDLQRFESQKKTEFQHILAEEREARGIDAETIRAKSPAAPVATPAAKGKGAIVDAESVIFAAESRGWSVAEHTQAGTGTEYIRLEREGSPDIVIRVADHSEAYAPPRGQRRVDLLDDGAAAVLNALDSPESVETSMGAAPYYPAGSKEAQDELSAAWRMATPEQRAAREDKIRNLREQLKTLKSQLKPGVAGARLLRSQIGSVEAAIQRAETDYPDLAKAKPEETKPAAPAAEQTTQGSGVVDFPLADIRADVDRFQNRDANFSEETARKIAEEYDPNKFDPVVLWRDPKDGQVYTLNHSRVEGMRRRGAKTIPARFFEGTEQQARNFAKIESNRLATKETLSESVKAYKLAQSEGYTKAKLKEFFGADVDFLDAIQHLNRDGEWMRFLGDATGEFPYIKRYARWVGELRGQYGENLTNAHETQLFDFVYRSGTRNVDISKDQFFGMVERQVDVLGYDPSLPLVLKRGEITTGARAHENTAEMQAELDDLRERRDKAKTAQEVEALTDDILKLERRIEEALRILGEQDLFGAAEMKQMTSERAEAAAASTKGDDDLQYLHAGFTPEDMGRGIDAVMTLVEKQVTSRDPNRYLEQFLNAVLSRPRRYLERFEAGKTAISVIERMIARTRLHAGKPYKWSEEVARKMSAADVRWALHNFKAAYRKGGAELVEGLSPETYAFAREWQRIMEYFAVLGDRAGIQVTVRVSVGEALNHTRKEVADLQKRATAGEKGLGHILAGAKMRLKNLESKSANGVKWTGDTRKEPFGKHIRKRYFPNILSDESRRAIQTKSGPLWDAIKAFAAEHDIEIAELESRADPIAAPADKKFASMEFPASLVFPDEIKGSDGKTYKMLETDPFRVLEWYIHNAARRIASVETIREVEGYGEDEYPNYHNAIAAWVRDTGQELADNGAGDKKYLGRGLFEAVWNVAIGHRPGGTRGPSHPVGAFVAGAENVGNALILTATQITQVGGVVPIVAEQGAKNSARAFLDIVSERMGNREAATLLEFLRDLGAWQRNALAYNTLTEEAGRRGVRFSRNLLRWTGMDFANRQLNKMASLAAFYTLRDEARTLQKGGKAGEFVKSKWERLYGWDVFTANEIAHQGVEASFDSNVILEVAQAIQSSAGRENVNMENPLDIPPVFEQPLVRRIFRFTSYSRAQGNIVADAVWEARRYGRFKKLAVVMFGAAGGGLLVDQLKEWALNRDRDDEWWYQLFRGGMGAGALGLPGNLAQRIIYAYKFSSGGFEGAFSTVAPPFLSFWYRTIADFGKFLKQRDADAFRKIYRRVPIFKAVDATIYRMDNDTIGGIKVNLPGSQFPEKRNRGGGRRREGRSGRQQHQTR